MVKSFENSPKIMSIKLMTFIKDMSDSDDEIQSEIESVTQTFTKLQQTDDLDLNALLHHLDVMFMDQAFDIERGHT